MQKFYDTLLKGLGAESVIFKNRLAPEETYNFPDQPVSCMPVEGARLQLVRVVPADEAENAEGIESLFNNGAGVTFDERQIGFEPDTAEFSDQEKAREAITYVVDFISEHKDFELLICGGCAGDIDSGYAKSLSEERANRVKQMVCEESDVDGAMIKTKVLGSSGPFHVEGIGFGADASVNRNVTFLAADGEQANEIINNF